MGLLHLDLRAWAVGGPVRAHVGIHDDDDRWLSEADFAARVAHKHLVLVTHGFNVRQDGGTVALEGWKSLAALHEPCVFVGLLWPGDSLFFPVLDYPMEVPVAMQSARLLGDFLTATAAAATAISMVSHSLGARVMLETARHIAPRRIDTLLVMAAAIEDDSLAREYADVTRTARRVVVVASRRDQVLEWAFPLGNPVGELLTRGHPYFRQALGRQGANPVPNEGAALEHWQIPDSPVDWDFGHGDYMPQQPLPPGRARIYSAPQKPPPSNESIKAGDEFVKNDWAAAVIATQWFAR